MSDIFTSVENLLISHLPDAKVKITDMTGTKDHLDILIISDQFIGKMIFEQHKMVMSILADRLKSDIHAVQLKTLTFAKAKETGIL